MEPGTKEFLETQIEVLTEHNLKLIYALQEIHYELHNVKNKYETMYNIDEITEKILIEMGILK